jgi:phosphoenolpyruvate-protein phosphotransferase (PTS system enzyme I)
VVERLLRAWLRQGRPDGLALPQVQGARDFAGEDPLVLVANDVAPADMLQFKRSVFTGFVTDVGGRTSHTAIVARSMDIPAVVGAREASRLIRQDDWLVIDGDAGVVIVNPSPIVLEEYRFRQRQSELERARLTACATRRRSRWTGSGRAAGQHRAAGDALAPWRRRGRRRAVPQRVPVHEPGGDLPDEDEQFEAYRARCWPCRGCR